MEIAMGRPPIGKTAMTGAERVRRYRLKHGLDKLVTKPASRVTKSAGPDPAPLLASMKAYIAELENKNAALVKKLEQAAAHFRKASANAHEFEARVADVIAENDALKAEIIALKKERQTFRDDRPVTKQPAQHEAEAEIAALRTRVSELEQELAPARKEADKARALIAAAEDFLDRKARIVPHVMYQTLLRSTHPDRVTDPKAKARYEKAFVFLKEHERTLAKKKPPPRPPGLPRTLAEWDAAKWHAREERKAKRAATRAAKAPRRHLPKT
jgi:uncharacterized protein YdcH (DUF465 family)